MKGICPTHGEVEARVSQYGKTKVLHCVCNLKCKRKRNTIKEANPMHEALTTGGPDEAAQEPQEDQGGEVSQDTL